MAAGGVLSRFEHPFPLIAMGRDEWGTVEYADEDRSGANFHPLRSAKAGGRFT